MKPFSDPVFVVETAMLASLLTVGFYTGYTDLKTRKVFNRYTLALLGIGLSGQAAMVALDVTTVRPRRCLARPRPGGGDGADPVRVLGPG